MGNKQGHELSPEEKQKLKEEKEREKKLLKEEKERKKREKKEEKKRKKEKKKRKAGGLSEPGDEDEDAESVGGSSAWSEKSQGSAPGSWYHSASEPSSKRSSIYLPASAGPGYYQHDCWYPGYEDSGSEKSKSPSRAPSLKDTLNIRAGSLERYPLGVPKGEPIEPLHKAGSLDLSSSVAKTYLKEREKRSSEGEITAAIASRYDETIRSSRDHIEYTTLDKEALKSKIVSERTSVTNLVSLDSSDYHFADEGSVRGEKRKASLEDRGPFSPVEGRLGSEAKRQSLDYASDHTSVTGSIYYSADEGGSIAGSVYYSATSGSEVEDHGDDNELLGKERPSAPGKPEAVDREGSALSKLAYIKVENDALLLRWDPPYTDGDSPITGYIIERSEGQGEMWVRVNLVPIKDTEFAVANLVGGREYRFRVSAENAVGMSDPSPSSEVVSISTDQEATEPHFLKELRDAIAVENQRVEFSVHIIGTPLPDITWYKDGFEVYDTRRFEFRVEGDRYTLVLKEAKLTDEGDIRVRATNRVGVASSQAALTVQAPPHIKLPAQYEQGLIFDTDELIRLRVPYTGRPQPQASWTHNGKQIEGDERHTMDVSDKYATLKIAGACRMDKGMYTLRLSNPQGEDNASFFVTVTDRPDPPSVPTITDVSGTSVTLRWDPPRDDGGCRVSNYIVEYFRVGWDVWLKATASRITWTQLSDLIVGSEYRFRIKSENAYGVSEPGEESLQILIEDAKSPTGYENIHINVDGGMQNCNQGIVPEGFMKGNNFYSQVSASFDQTGMVIETVSLKRSQALYEEKIMKGSRLEDFPSHSNNDNDSDSDPTLKEQHQVESHEIDFSSSDTDISDNSEEVSSACSETLSLDQTTTSLLGPIVVDSLGQRKSLGTYVVGAEIGMVRGGLAPTYHLGTLKSPDIDSVQSETMNSESTESCSLGTTFIATVEVYQPWAVQGNSPCAYHYRSTHEKEVNTVRGLDPQYDALNTSLVANFLRINVNYPFSQLERDMPGSMAPSRGLKIASGTCLADETGCDRSDDGVTGTPIVRDVSGDVVTGTPILRDASEDGVTGTPVVRDASDDGVTGTPIVRDASDDGVTGTPIVRYALEDGVTGTPIVNGASENRVKVPQIALDTDEEATANKAVRNADISNINNNGDVMKQVTRDVYNGGTANQIVKDIYNIGATVNQIVGDIYTNGVAAYQARKDVTCDKAATNRVMGEVYINKLKENAMENAGNRETAVNQIRDFSNEGVVANHVVETISNERLEANVAMHLTEVIPVTQTSQVNSNRLSTADHLIRSISSEKSTGNSVVRNLKSEEAPCSGVGGTMNKEPGNNELHSIENEISAAGGQWTTQGRIAIANQFRIICGGLASMTHLGNINVRGKQCQGNIINSERATDYSEQIEDDESTCSSASSLKNDRDSDSSLDTVYWGKDVQNLYDHMAHDTTAVNQKAFLSLEGPAVSMLRDMRMRRMAGNQQGLWKNQAFSSVQETSRVEDMEVNRKECMHMTKSMCNDLSHERLFQRHTATLGESRIKANPIEMMEYESTDYSQTVIDFDHQSSPLRSESTTPMNKNEAFQSIRRKSVTPQDITSVYSRDLVPRLTSTSVTTNKQKIECPSFDHSAEDSLNLMHQNIDEVSSWEPKITQEITSRIDLLEDLVYRCMENEDVTLNNLGVSDDECSAAPSPFAPLSRVSSSGCVDLRRGELRHLISDLSELVSNMNEKSGTLSADNIAKFFEKTASVVKEHSVSPAMYRKSGSVVEDGSHQSSRTHSVSDVDWALEDLPYSSDPGNIIDVIQPYNQVHIQSSILDRITYLDDVMNRCLEHEDVTLNTLGSPVVSPCPMAEAESREERVDASKIELKDLIGNLGSMISGLGQKFNANWS